jgi:hypothetical protein
MGKFMMDNGKKVKNMGAVCGKMLQIKHLNHISVNGIREKFKVLEFTLILKVIDIKGNSKIR